MTKTICILSFKKSIILENGKKVSMFKTKTSTPIQAISYIPIKLSKENSVIWYDATEYQLPAKNKISKARHCFIWNNQYFELDVFKDNLSGLILLEIELLKKDQKIDLPSFINIDKEVTSDDRYSNFCLAKKHNE